MEVTVQDGDTINIPRGLKPIIKDTYITFKKQPIFKNGDILIFEQTDESYKCKTIFIYNGEQDENGYYHFHILRDVDGELLKDSYIICDSGQLRHATIAEKYAFLQQLKQENLKWNDNENKIEHINWRAKKNEKYFHLYSNLKVDSTTESGTWIDDEMYDSGNYFRTKDLACQCRLELLSTLRKFHEDIKE